MKAHRLRLRKRGLRPIQIWLPDVRSHSFTVEARRQSLAVARSARAKADQRFIDAISDQAVE
ncbi:MAG TPA: antitoxin MazE-like protein [Candidatus Binataceae bacterium]|nr:antitoxin MazE-like protein [Candidatus Binataceae bacterium]